MCISSLRAAGGGRAARAIVLVAAALAGCAPSTYIPLTPDHASAITTTRVHATIAQDEVDAVVLSPNLQAPGAGVLGSLLVGLVDAGVTSYREHDAANQLLLIRPWIADFDFRAGFFSSLQRTLPSLNTLRAAHFTTSKLAPTPEVQSALRATTAEDTLLQVTTRYALSPDFRTFSVVTTAEIWRHGQDEALYRSTFTYLTDPIVTSGDSHDAALAWAAHHAAAMHTAMYEGIDETMKMLALDLGAGGAAAVTAAAARTGPTATAQHGREIVRRKNGIMYSAPYEPPPPPTPPSPPTEI